MTNILEDYLLKGLNTEKSLDDFAAGKIQSIFENPDTHSRFFIEEMCSGINGNRDKYAACRKDVFADMIRYEGCLKDKSLKVIIISFCARFGFYDLLERIAESYDLSGSYCYMDIPLVECIESKAIDKATKLKVMNVLLANNCINNYSAKSIEYFILEFST